MAHDKCIMCGQPGPAKAFTLNEMGMPGCGLVCTDCEQGNSAAADVAAAIRNLANCIEANNGECACFGAWFPGYFPAENQQENARVVNGMRVRAVELEAGAEKLLV